MKTMFLRGGVVLSLLTVLSLVGGCSNKPEPKEKAHKSSHKDGEGHSSPDGWWCNEHGIPEDECIECSKKLKTEAKAKGDWCQKHDRAKSQCFICDPKLKEKYAARYRERYGKEPPEPNE